MKFLLKFCVIIASYCTFCDCQNHVDITLVGGYGDLAKKYLWKAFFKLYVNNLLSGKWTYNFHGAGTKNFTTGTTLLQNILSDVLPASCSSMVGNVNCSTFMNNFVKQIHYRQLENERDYAEYCSTLFASAMQNQCHKGHSCEYQSIFYLSVPPFAYKNISSFIANHCRSFEDSGVLKVVYEKPFGHNKASAVDLAVAIEANLHSDEVYRVDHYLGKQTVKEILSFRRMNTKVNEMLNNQFVERIEIVMKETVDAKGRTKYYDKYGVIADVMQNHLSEILLLLTMDLPSAFASTEEINQSKLSVLQAIETLSVKNVVIGQYEEYANHVTEEVKPEDSKSNTPTFAGVKISIVATRWINVPIVMVAGKKLDERTSYARIVFKDEVFSVEKSHGCPTRSELIFHFGNSILGKPALLISRNLPINETYVPQNWHETTEFHDLNYFGQNISCFKVFTPNLMHDAYEFLVEQIFKGRREHFLTLPGLLESWRVWDDVVQSNDAVLQKYSGGDATSSLLDFSYVDNEIKFGKPLASLTKERSFLGCRSIVDSKFRISFALAEKIASAIRKSAQEDKDFHIAFSGGYSPSLLFEILGAMSKNILWNHVHIWQVDERCTLNSNLSNFETLTVYLIDKLPGLKFKNVHPMPIETSFEVLCSESGAKLYEKRLKRLVGNPPKLDFVILGMGADGHTASLFPYHKLLDETERFVAVADNVANENTVPRRMTITFPLIRFSKHISILVTGKNKCDIVQKLSNGHCDDTAKYPICMVPQLSDQTTWYIDKLCEFS